MVSLIGVLIAIMLIGFNYKYRNFRYIQMSYPIANDFMLVGVIICLISVIFFGLDGKKIHRDYFVVMCHARAWFITMGFSLYFGSMFAKTWISYRLTTGAGSSKVSLTGHFLAPKLFN